MENNEDRIKTVEDRVLELEAQIYLLWALLFPTGEELDPFDVPGDRTIN